MSLQETWSTKQTVCQTASMSGVEAMTVAVANVSNVLNKRFAMKRLGIAIVQVSGVAAIAVCLAKPAAGRKSARDKAVSPTVMASGAVMTMAVATNASAVLKTLPAISFL